MLLRWRNHKSVFFCRVSKVSSCGLLALLFIFGLSQVQIKAIAAGVSCSSPLFPAAEAEEIDVPTLSEKGHTFFKTALQYALSLSHTLSYKCIYLHGIGYGFLESLCSSQHHWPADPLSSRRWFGTSEGQEPG